jgi:hypothetical protein
MVTSSFKKIIHLCHTSAPDVVFHKMNNMPLRALPVATEGIRAWQTRPAPQAENQLKATKKAEDLSSSQSSSGNSLDNALLQACIGRPAADVDQAMRVYRSKLEIEFDFSIRKKKAENEINLIFSKMEKETQLTMMQAENEFDQRKRLRAAAVESELFKMEMSLVEQDPIRKRRRLLEIAQLDQQLAAAKVTNPTDVVLPPPPPEPSTAPPIFVSDVAKDMGFYLEQGDLTKAGRMIAKLYRQRYNMEPTTHTQVIAGKERPVKSYTTRDRDLIVQAIRVVTAGKQPLQRAPIQPMAI